MMIRPQYGTNSDTFYHPFFCRCLKEHGRKMSGRKMAQNRASVMQRLDHSQNSRM